MKRYNLISSGAGPAESMAEVIDPSLLPVFVGDVRLRGYKSGD